MVDIGRDGVRLSGGIGRIIDAIAGLDNLR